MLAFNRIVAGVLVAFVALALLHQPQRVIAPSPGNHLASH
jgi:hypothetical protein